MQQRRPLMLAVVGDSAAGKTTLSRGIAALFGPDRVTVVCLDDYHKYDRKQRRELGITALNPDCNYIDIMEQHLNLLRLGQPILKPVYNHSTGTFDPPEYVCPRQVVIVEGLLGLYTPALQKCYDVAVYLSPDERLRQRWKVTRDTARRGYSEAEVLRSIERRMSDSRAYIWPQQKAADLVVRFYPPAGYFQRDTDNAHLNVRIIQRHTLPRPDLSDVAEVMPNRNGRHSPLRLEPDAWSGGQPVDILEIDGSIEPDRALELEKLIWAHLDFAEDVQSQQLGRFVEGRVERHSYPLALTQLLVVYYLLTVRRHWPVDLM